MIFRLQIQLARSFLPFSSKFSTYLRPNINSKPFSLPNNLKTQLIFINNFNQNCLNFGNFQYSTNAQNTALKQEMVISVKSAITKSYGDVLELETNEREFVLAPNEILIESKTSALTFTDLLMCRGKYQIKPEVPFIAGREVCGNVVRIGEAVKELKPGDKVFAFLPSGGGFTTHAKTTENNCFPLPSNMKYEIADAMYASYVTAYLGLVHKAQLTSHDKVLVTGAGGALGLAVIDICANVFKTKVIGVTSTAQKSEIIREKGAFATIEIGDAYKKRDKEMAAEKKVSHSPTPKVGDSAKPVTTEAVKGVEPDQQIKKAGGSGEKSKNIIKDKVDYLTDKHGVDVVFETIGGSVFEDCYRCLAFDGRLIIAGFAGGTIPTIVANKLLLNNVSVMGFTQTNYYNHRDTHTAYKEAFEAVTSYWEKGYIKPTIDINKRFSIDQINEAMEYVKSAHAVGKIIINIA